MVEMTIDNVRVSLVNYQCEADAIKVKLHRVDEPQPVTRNLLKSTINIPGATVNTIIVNELKNDTYYTKVIVDIDNKQLEVDSHASDALALMVRTDVPHQAGKSVLVKAGISLDTEIGESRFQRRVEVSGKEPTVSDEDIKKNMPAFYDFIDTLDLDDLDKHESLTVLK